MDDFYYQDNSDNWDYSAMDCSGCSLWRFGSCYLDGDNHTNCIDVLIPMKTSNVIGCQNFR